MTIDEKVFQLTEYLTRMDESRDSWAQQACMHSPIASLGDNGLRVLEALDCGGSLSMGALSDRIGIPLSTLTGIVDKLVEKGFLERSRSRHDRRVVEVGITGFGLRSISHRKSAHETKSRHILSVLDPAEQDTLLKILAKIVNA